jgi:hypothetical protein
VPGGFVSCVLNASWPFRRNVDASIGTFTTWLAPGARPVTS